MRYIFRVVEVSMKKIIFQFVAEALYRFLTVIRGSIGLKELSTMLKRQACLKNSSLLHRVLWYAYRREITCYALAVDLDTTRDLDDPFINSSLVKKYID